MIFPAFGNNSMRGAPIISPKRRKSVSWALCFQDEGDRGRGSPHGTDGYSLSAAVAGAAAVAGQQQQAETSAEVDNTRPEALAVAAAGGAGNSGNIAASPVVLLSTKILTSTSTTTTTASKLPASKTTAVTPDPDDAGKCITTGHDLNSSSSGSSGSSGSSSQTTLLSPPFPTIATTTTTTATNSSATANVVTAASILPARPAAALSGRSVAETLAALHRAHLAALQLQEGTALANEALRVENSALKKKNDAWKRESRSLRDGFSLALQDNREWCRENKVLGQEYAQAFEAKLAEVFDRNAELEQDDKILREENGVLRVAAEESARRHSEVLRETSAWRHENAILHEEYAEHLVSSAQFLAENVSLKEQIAVSNHEYARVIARNKAHADDMTLRVRQALYLNGGVAGNNNTTTTTTTSPTISEKLLEGALLSPPGEANNRRSGSTKNANSDAPRLPLAGRGGLAGREEGSAQIRRRQQLLHRQTRRLEQQELEQVARQRERKIEEELAGEEIWGQRAVSSSDDDVDKDSSLVHPAIDDSVQQGTKKGGEGEDEHGRRRTTESARGAVAAGSPQCRVGLVDTVPAIVSSSSSLSVFSSDEDGESDGDGGSRVAAAAAAAVAISRKGSTERLLERWSGVSGAGDRGSEVSSGSEKPVSDARTPADPIAASASLTGKQEQQAKQHDGTPGESWKEDNVGWLKKTRAWQQANGVLKRSLTSPEEIFRGQKQQQRRRQQAPQQQEQRQQEKAIAEVDGGAGSRYDGGSKWGDDRGNGTVKSRDGVGRRPEQRHRVLSLPQRLALQLENRARLGHLDTMKNADSQASQSGMGVYSCCAEEFSEGGSTEEDL